MNVPYFLGGTKFKYRNSREEVLPSDMGSKMRVVIASRGSGLPTDATDVRLFPGVHLRGMIFRFPLVCNRDKVPSSSNYHLLWITLRWSVR